MVETLLDNCEIVDDHLSAVDERCRFQYAALAPFPYGVDVDSEEFCESFVTSDGCGMFCHI